MERIIFDLIKGAFQICFFGPILAYRYYKRFSAWRANRRAGKEARNPKPLEMSMDSRFAHMLVVGGSGHGKTQLLQSAILLDLPEVAAGRRSVIVIDSQGDMINKLLHLNALSPLKEELAERLVLIDPTDTKYPPCLNMFDLGLDRAKAYDELEREKLLNGAIALYEYMFGALLGAELTNRQGVIFTYIARLLMVVPGATIYTLLDFMEEPELARPYIAKLDVSAQRFFNTQFFNSTFDTTRQQIAMRLWGILSKPALARLFTHKQNKVDLFSAMNRGSLILINTAKDLLKQDGTAIFGRFMISLISQATQERAAINEFRRLPTFVYIDEAQDYFEEAAGLEQLITQGRKYKVGLTIAHQNLSQLDHRLRATVLASTATKFAGGVSSADASVLAKDMALEPEYIAGLKKYKDHSEFACFDRSFTPPSGMVQIWFGALENEPKMGAVQFQDLIEHNRTRFCAPVDQQILTGSKALTNSGVVFALEEPKGV